MNEQKVLRIFAGILFIVLFVLLAIYIPYEYFYDSKIHNLRLSVGDKYILNIQNDEYTFVSSNEEVAIVDSTGVINILDFGTAKVTVKDKNNKMKYRYDITVEYNNETSLELYPQQLELKTGDTYKLIHKYISTSEPKEIKWESSNSNIVSVDSNGVVKGISNGTSTVKLTIDGLEKECIVNVSAVNNSVEPNYDVDNNKPEPVVIPEPTPTPEPQPQPVEPTPGQTTISVTGVSLSKSKLDLNVGGTTVVTATVSPSNATNRTVTWTSSNTKVATVSNGTIKAVGVGTANITVKTNDGSKTATVKVTVTKKQTTNPKPVVTTNKEEEVKEVAVESISSSITDKSIYVSETYQIVTVITPSDAKTNLTYKSSNTKVATVSDKGKVTGLSKGNAVITVTSTNNKTYSINITVNELVISPTKKTFKATIVGNGANVEKDSLSCNTVGISCKVTLPNITRSGYNIIGYSTNQDATSAEYKVGATIDLYNDTTLYAITSKGVTATFLPSEYVSNTKGSCTMYNTNTSCRVITPNINRANYASLGFNTDSNAGNGIVGVNSELYISGDTTYYAITKINQDGIIAGCTGWAAKSISYYSSPNGGVEGTLSVGQVFTINSLEGQYFKVTIPGKSGYKYVQHSYVMINLSDYIPSIVYNITNASSSIYRSSGYDLPGITGTKLYTGGKVYNLRLRNYEYMVPLLYSTANMVLNAENRFKNEGYRLKIYDAYRPNSVSRSVSNALANLYNSNSTVKSGIQYSYGASGKRYEWGQQYFIATTSNHNYGIAIDATLTNASYQELQMPTAMHELSTKAIKYYSGGVAKVPANYSKEMNDNAKYYDSVMTSVGFGTISGEWWHFQENGAAGRIGTPCNFQVTEVHSY